MATAREHLSPDPDAAGARAWAKRMRERWERGELKGDEAFLKQELRKEKRKLKRK